MFRAIVVVVSFGIAALAGAQNLSFTDIKAKSGTQLTGDELKQLLPGAKVTSRTPTGSTRYWQSKPDGTLVATSDAKGTNVGSTKSYTGNGTWRVDANGTFCVEIEWPRQSEKWCRYVFKSGDKYYAFTKLEDGATANELEFSK